MSYSAPNLNNPTFEIVKNAILLKLSILIINFDGFWASRIVQICNNSQF